MNIFPLTYTRKQYFGATHSNVEEIASMFTTLDIDCSTLPKTKQTLIRAKLKDYIKDKYNLLEICIEQQNSTGARLAIVDIKRAVETMPYKLNTKQNLYTEIRKELKKILTDKVSKSQETVIALLFALTDIEQIKRNSSTEELRQIKNINTTDITTDFIENIYMPIAIELLQSNFVSNMTIALIMITGRRPSEVLQTMELDFTNYEKTKLVAFTGQKKTEKELFGRTLKSGDGTTIMETRDKNSELQLNIPLMIADEHIELLKRRLIFFQETIKGKIIKGKAVKDLNYRQFSDWIGFIRSAFAHEKLRNITNTIGTQLKGLRGLYACYFTYLSKVENKTTYSHNAYLTSILGHDDQKDPAKNYEIFNVHAIKRTADTVIENPVKKLIPKKKPKKKDESLG